MYLQKSKISLPLRMVHRGSEFFFFKNSTFQSDICLDNDLKSWPKSFFREFFLFYAPKFVFSKIEELLQ